MKNGAILSDTPIHFKDRKGIEEYFEEHKAEISEFFNQDLPERKGLKNLAVGTPINPTKERLEREL